MKTYTFSFGTSGSPTGFSGLTPTMLIFYNLATGTTNSPPSITETPTGWGIYSFQYGTTQPIWFLVDAATTSPGVNGRYVWGQIDPADRTDEYAATIIALGNSNIAIGTTVAAISSTLSAIGLTLQAIGNTTNANVGSIGSTISLMGDNTHDPVDLFGYMKRLDALMEGQQQFIKSSGLFTQFDKTGATTLSLRTVTNNASLVTRT